MCEDQIEVNDVVLMDGNSDDNELGDGDMQRKKLQEKRRTLIEHHRDVAYFWSIFINIP